VVAVKNEFIFDLCNLFSMVSIAAKATILTYNINQTLCIFESKITRFT